MAQPFILKLYHRADPASGSSFWNDNWARMWETSARPALEHDPFYPLYRRYLSRTHYNLEGGCGHGEWVALAHQLGCPIIGLDFATDALRGVKQRHPDLCLLGGNVARLPFRDRSLGCYYSGGVVEHFEAGPEPALAEARRVLRDDGTLLISVPYLSPLRRWRYAGSESDHEGGFGWRWVQTHEVEPPPRPGMTFYQYVYAESHFRRMLETAGFRVLESHGLYLLHGLLHEGLLPRWLQGQPSAKATAGESGPAVPARRSGIKALAKRFLVNEDNTGMLAPLAPMLRICRNLFANMRMYVCRPVPRGLK